MTNFDEIIERRNTDSLKYDFAARRGLPEDVLPLWVADMDFRTPPCVIEALVEKSRHGIFGYSESREDYFAVLKSWFSRRFGWKVQPEWLIKTPGVVYAICMAIRALTSEGDAVLIQQPVYYPFESSVINNDRELVVNELAYENGRYHIDFEDFERKITQHRVKMFILCSPHNPVGRVWTKEELTRMGDICVKHGVIVVADEIHADFVYPGYSHTVFANIKPEFADITVTCTAPTKTFNLAGLQISNIFVSNQRMRKRIKQEISRTGYSQLNVMGMVACKAAYAQGEEWLEELKAYLQGNLDFVRSFVSERMPEIRLVEPEGTYLIWLDCRALGLNDKALDDLVIQRAKLWLDGGHMFGQGGSGFQRLNIACPRSLLEQAMERLAAAVANR
ncbi:MAG: pyridoxal phosphate-dependent aminotransferase [Christensenellaceae bacterium]|nr:pyridoxal phosphate-dependent aminotransferase [Christensenellaceae bacterium]